LGFNHFGWWKQIAGTGFFSSELNAKLYRAALPFLLVSQGSLGFGRAPTTHTGRSTVPTGTGHDAQRRRDLAGILALVASPNHTVSSQATYLGSFTVAHWWP
jgi:hypothetical protein